MAALLLVAAFLSGTAALAAEVVWFRSLGRGVGTTAEALAVVSAAFLGGLGIGAAISARLAPTHRNPLRAAAWCETAAGVLIFLSPLVLAFVPDAHLAVLHLLRLEPGRSSWPAAVVALPVLVIPTAFLGATLPFLVRGALKDVARAGRATGWLYGVNTLGAATGVWLATWHLLPGFGETSSLRLAASGNLLAALLLVIAEGASHAGSAATPPPPPDSAPTFPPPSPPRPDSGPISPPLPPPPPDSAPLAPASPLPPLAPAGSIALPGGLRARLPAITLFLTGALALGGEVAWFRLLEPITGIHVFGFAILLGAVLLGTAVGGALGGRLADKVRRPDLAMAWALALGGALLVLSVWTAGALPWFSLREGSSAAATAKGANLEWNAVREAGWDALRTARIVGACLCIAPPLVAFSAAYPLAVRARSSSASSAAGTVGPLYAWNTAGTVVGSLLGGFLLLPGIGGPRTLAALGGLGIAAASALVLLAPRPRSWIPAAVLALPLVALALPGSGRTLDAAGPSLPEVAAMGSWDATYRIRSRADMAVLGDVIGGTYPRPAGRPGADPILPREGVMSSVGLLEERGYVRLRQGGLSESRIQPHEPDTGSETEVALALFPWLLHPTAKDALVIGHGAGWTAEAMISTGVRTDVAELEPAVLDVTEEYRGGPLLVRRAPNATLKVTDGRLLLREAARVGGGYDLIVSQPSHPWVPGAGHLFTREAYRLARSALRKDGVFAQWLNIFNMTRELFQTALKSWYEAFPSSWVLLYNDEVILIGFTGDATIDVPGWRKALADSPAGTRARAAGIEGPEDLLRRVMLDGDALGRFLPPDRLPSTDDLPLLELGLAEIRFTRIEDAWKEKEAIFSDLRAAFPPGFERMIPDRAARDRVLAKTARRILDVGSLEDARRFLRSVPFDGGVDGRLARAEEAMYAWRNASTDATVRKDMAARAADLLLAARELDPKDAEVALARLTVLVDTNRLSEAIREGEVATAAFPDDGRIWAIHARALITNGEAVRADEAFTKALEAQGVPFPPGTGYQHARALLTMTASPTRALQARARDALRKDPGTLEDREALRRLEELENELSEDGPNVQTAADAVARTRRELDRRRGFEQVELALRYVDREAKRGLDAAREATTLIPNEAVAWRVRGWFELRRDDVTSAATSLRKAIALAEDPAAERRTAVGYFRIFSKDETLLDEDAP